MNIEAAHRMYVSNGVIVTYSDGRGLNGKNFAYIRPAEPCCNRSRRIGGMSPFELNAKVKGIFNKWYSPINYYEIEGKVIGSNSKGNALKEFWRICEKENIGEGFIVTIIKSE